ncbi:MAG: ABC transporter ATP-binding protein [Duodenibacillus sp.]|nr:ABC transporter ATP-binding protein [Duodenibacillus sp.]
MTARLRLNNITKTYPGIRANDAISLEVQPGEVLAILGENGAGKSTLMKIIFGSVAPDCGEIEFDGVPVKITSPSVARQLGIAMVHQHFAVFETLTVAQNVVLGLPGSDSLAVVSARIRELGDHYGIPVDPDAVVADLAMGERQRVEIIRALMTNPKLLILDEPTSVLTPQAVRRLFETLKKLSAEGVSIVFISHKLDEIRELADRCTVLRAGRVVETVVPAQETEQSLARLMIGSEPPKLREKVGEPGKVALELNHLSLDGGHHVSGVSNVTLQVRAGEIVGIAGISGNGQSRLLGVVMGELKANGGSVRLNGQDLTHLGAAERRKMGLRYVPEQRLGHGSVPEFSLLSNTILTGDQFHKRGILLRKSAAEYARSVIERFKVKTTSELKPAQALSGGNLQKFIVGREILNRPSVLMIDQPTWGVDVGAATVIHNALMRLREEGAGILIVSEEVDELYAVCDRIAVMYRGCLSPAVPVSSIATDELGRWMAGLWPGSPFRQRTDLTPDVPVEAKVD